MPQVVKRPAAFRPSPKPGSAAQQEQVEAPVQGPRPIHWPRHPNSRSRRPAADAQNVAEQPSWPGRPETAIHSLGWETFPVLWEGPVSPMKMSTGPNDLDCLARSYDPSLP